MADLKPVCAWCAGSKALRGAEVDLRKSSVSLESEAPRCDIVSPSSPVLKEQLSLGTMELEKEFIQ